MSISNVYEDESLGGCDGVKLQQIVHPESWLAQGRGGKSNNLPSKSKRSTVTVSFRIS